MPFLKVLFLARQGYTGKQETLHASFLQNLIIIQILVLWKCSQWLQRSEDRCCVELYLETRALRLREVCDKETYWHSAWPAMSEAVAAEIPAQVLSGRQRSRRWPAVWPWWCCPYMFSQTFLQRLHLSVLLLLHGVHALQQLVLGLLGEGLVLFLLVALGCFTLLGSGDTLQTLRFQGLHKENKQWSHEWAYVTNLLTKYLMDWLMKGCILRSWYLLFHIENPSWMPERNRVHTSKFVCQKLWAIPKIR